MTDTHPAYEKSIRFIDASGSAYAIPRKGNLPQFGIDGVSGTVTVSGSLEVSSSHPYLYNIAEGNVSGHAAMRLFGHNTNVGTSFETITEQGGVISLLSSAEQLQLVSTSNNDTSGASGATSVTVHGMGGGYALKSETIAMGGTGAVTTTGSFLRAFDAVVETAGTSGPNLGDISVKNNAGTSTLLTIVADEGHSHAAVWTVPTGTTLYITQIWGTESSTKGSDFHFYLKETGKPWHSEKVFNVLDSVFVIPFLLPLLIPEKSDIEMRAKAILSGANVTAGVEGWYETN